MAFQGGLSCERAARPGVAPAGGQDQADQRRQLRRVWPIMDDKEREAIRAEGLCPNNSAAVAALEP